MTPSSIALADHERTCARLAQAFVIYLDQARYTEVAALFVPDGVLHRVSGEILSGRAAIARGLQRSDDQVVIHHASSVFVERVSTDEATGISSFLAFSRAGADDAVITRVAAIWHDRYHCIEERWLISERKTEVRFHGLR